MGFGEISRLTLLRGTSKPLSSLKWQKYGCKFYIVSNLGFSEPTIALIYTFLLHSALQKKDSGTQSQRWIRKTFVYITLLCLPVFIFQLVLVLLGHKCNKEETPRTGKMANFFLCSSSLVNNVNICTYPLLSTIILGAYHLLVFVYVVYIGTRLLSLVINKELRMRVILLSLSIILLPLRVLLLGFSVLPRAGNLAYELLVFLAFLVLSFCNNIGIYMLVYLPVEDSLALRNIERHIAEGDDVPYDDYYGAFADCKQESPGNESEFQCFNETGSISFRTIVKDDAPVLDNIEEEWPRHYVPLQIISPARSPVG
ncbi:hypothetical protein HPP92_004080 [Vanilla planifolia]|uniref:Uncharacterized protein n=1 Tax=Vanilla planifolia TaxID=51239 RepID=A0A835S1V3_VANPL|nr:hypothetical protein HPP92_004505 [Vanilla planifolia]KAG0504008.1 hypothetical protein HPP92_004080 [Vanilla planifolia]